MCRAAPAPSLVGAPTALSFTTAVGGAYDFGPHATDAEGGILTFALVSTAYTGISLSTAGLLTVTTAASTAVRRLTIRVTDETGLSSDHVCDVTVGALKWYPGHYAAPDAVLFSDVAGGAYDALEPDRVGGRISSAARCTCRGASSSRRRPAITRST